MHLSFLPSPFAPLFETFSVHPSGGRPFVAVESRRGWKIRWTNLRRPIKKNTAPAYQFQRQKSGNSFSHFRNPPRLDLLPALESVSRTRFDDDDVNPPSYPPCPAWVQRTSKATTPLPTLGGNVHHHLHPPSISPSPTDLATYLPTYHRLPPSTDLHRSEPSNHSTDPTLSTLSSPPARFYIRLHHVHPLRPCISVTYASDVCVSMYGICMYIYTESSILKWRNSGRYRAARYRYTRYIRIYVHGVSGMGDASPSSLRYIRYNA